jgi:hypothetical protein
MRTRLILVEQRIAELEKLADEISALADRFVDRDAAALASLETKLQMWRLGAEGLLEKVYPSGLSLFHHYYCEERGILKFVSSILPDVPNRQEFLLNYHVFKSSFSKARGMILGCLERLKSLECDLLIQLSSALVLDEIETSRQLCDAANGDESILRAAGTITRVALERHLFAIAEARSVAIQANRGKPMAQDAVNSLTKANVLTKIQKSELETLFRIGNLCAHPKESISSVDVEKLIVRGKAMVATII